MHRTFRVKTSFGYFCDCRHLYGFASDEATHTAATVCYTPQVAELMLKSARKLFPNSECELEECHN